MNGDSVLILTALYFEARPIVRELGLRFVSRTTAVGLLPSGVRVSLQIVGPRAGRMPSPPATGEYKLVIMAGVAGGLSPDLKQGDVVLDDQSSTGGLGLTLRRGPFASVASIVATPGDKAELYRVTGALVVDMENATARAWAAGHNIPFIGLRAVSDTSSETLEPAILRAVGADGYLRPRCLVADVLRRPTLFVTLWRLRTSGRVVEILAREVGRLVRSLS